MNSRAGRLSASAIKDTHTHSKVIGEGGGVLRPCRGRERGVRHVADNSISAYLGLHGLADFCTDCPVAGLFRQSPHRGDLWTHTSALDLLNQKPQDLRKAPACPSGKGEAPGASASPQKEISAMPAKVEGLMKRHREK